MILLPSHPKGQSKACFPGVYALGDTFSVVTPSSYVHPVHPILLCPPHPPTSTPCYSRVAGLTWYFGTLPLLHIIVNTNQRTKNRVGLETRLLSQQFSNLQYSFMASNTRMRVVAVARDNMCCYVTTITMNWMFHKMKISQYIKVTSRCISM